MTKPVKWADKPDPDAWVLFDEDLGRWIEARLIRSTERPKPLLVDEFNRHHEVGNETRCMRMSDYFEIGDLTKIKHKWLVDGAHWAPVLTEGDHLGSGFQVRSWRNVR